MADPLSIATWRNIFTKHGQKLGWGLAVLFGLPLVVGFGMNQYSGHVNPQAVSAAAAQSSTFATVNGEPITQGEFAAALRTVRGTTPGEQFAVAQGQIVDRLVTLAVARQEAKARGVKASDADVDRALAQERDSLGKNISDAEWENYVQSMHNMSLSDYRDAMAKQALIPALVKSFQDEEKITPDEARNQSAEVKLTSVLIPTAASPMMPLPKGVTVLPDADAKKKADALLAQAKGGGDIGAIARANSADPGAQRGGDKTWRPEYQVMSPQFGALSYGKDFDEAVHKTQPGQFTDVVKASGLAQGYVFAKLLERRNNVPKDFDAKKVTDQLKQQRGGAKIEALILAKVKSAQIVFSDPDKKAFYDLSKLRQMDQQRMMAQLGQAGPDAPTAETYARQQKMVDDEMEALLKKHPDDPSVALVVAASLKTKRYAKDTTPAQQDQIRDRLILLDETALKTTEDRNTRFELADLYRDKKQPDLADKQYALLSRLLNADPPYDVNTMQTALDTRKRLVSSFRAVNQPAEADKQQAEVTKLEQQLTVERQKQAEAQKAQAAPGAVNLNVPPGGNASATQTVPAPGAAKGTPPVQTAPPPVPAK